MFLASKGGKISLGESASERRADLQLTEVDDSPKSEQRKRTRQSLQGPQSGADSNATATTPITASHNKRVRRV